MSAQLSRHANGLAPIWQRAGESWAIDAVYDAGVGGDRWPNKCQALATTCQSLGRIQAQQLGQTPF
eukprot:9260622-Alexandrium_andersonii.AAC.1